MPESDGGAPRQHVALSTSCLFLADPPETFRVASELGYDSVEVLVTHQRMTQLTHELLDASQQYQVPISAIHAPTLFFTQQVWGRPWTKIQMAAKMVEQTGAEVVVAHPPFAWQPKYGKSFVEGVRALSEMTGVKIAVENMYPWRLAGKELQMYRPHWDPRKFDYDWVTWDFSHASIAQVNSLEAIRELRPRLGHIHLTDGNDGGTSDEHLLPGHGQQPVAESLNFLADHGWDGVIGVEVNTRSAKDEDERASMLAESLAFARGHFRPGLGA
ncbi:sugar phosphate isomerase/epimerase [Kocuria sp. JC486]|uniref:sugar phosphate isomerase/epimerase family protein n=1 Tax=Kocuria sp. JC486 TaxID=1970736 RepID=UPI001422492E|nr:sugar phosphate isomerase/epimerase [Kocuria sp. JC486]NHU84643.1 sugar phosphate isomerase/epimerase [Kocuria sp. JC486]